MTGTGEFAVAFSAGAAACMYIYRQVNAHLRERRIERRDERLADEGRRARTAESNGEAGKKPVSFWDARFAGLETQVALQTEILNRQTEILGDHGQILTKLVTIVEMNSRMIGEK